MIPERDRNGAKGGLDTEVEQRGRESRKKTPKRGEMKCRVTKRLDW